MGIDKTLLNKAKEAWMERQDEEDGGPGSGNWGHKGRAGLRGGSGKGGGKQYRGSATGYGKYYGSKGDWMNGLSGEEQHEIQRFMKSAGPDIPTAEKKILGSGNKSDIRKMLAAKSKARSFDEKYSQLAKENLSDDEWKAFNSLFIFASGDGTFAEKMLNGCSPEEEQYAAELLNKAMGGGDIETPIPDSLADRSGLPRVHVGTNYEKLGNELNRLTQIEGLGRGAWARMCQRDLSILTKTPLGDMAAGLEKLENEGFNLPGANHEKLFELMTHMFNATHDISLASTLSNPYCSEEVAALKDLMGLSRGATGYEVAMAMRRKFTGLKSQEIITSLARMCGLQDMKMTLGKSVPRTAEECAARIRSIRPDAGTKEVELVLKECGAFKDPNEVKLGRMFPGAARALARSFASVIEKYPFMAGHFDHVKQASLKSGVMAQCWTFGSGIDVNSKYFSHEGYGGVEKAYESDVRSGFHPEGTTYEAVVDHEIGHAVSNWINDKYGGRCQQDILERVADALYLPPYECQRQVSTYATHNASEFIAECFAEVSNSRSPRRVAVECVRQLHKLLDEKGVKYNATV